MRATSTEMPKLSNLFIGLKPREDSSHPMLIAVTGEKKWAYVFTKKPKGSDIIAGNCHSITFLHSVSHQHIDLILPSHYCWLSEVLAFLHATNNTALSRCVRKTQHSCALLRHGPCTKRTRSTFQQTWYKLLSVEKSMEELLLDLIYTPETLDTVPRNGNERKRTLYAIQVSWNRRWISWPLLSVTTEKARWLPGPNDPWEANMPIPKATALAEDLPTCPANPAVNMMGPIPISSCILLTLTPSSQHRHYSNDELLNQQRMQITWIRETNNKALEPYRRFLYVKSVWTFSRETLSPLLHKNPVSTVFKQQHKLNREIIKLGHTWVAMIG